MTRYGSCVEVVERGGVQKKYAAYQTLQHSRPWKGGITVRARICVCNSYICVSYTSYGTNFGDTYCSTSTSRDSKDVFTTSNGGNTPQGPSFGCWAATPSKEIWKGYQRSRNIELLCFVLSLVFKCFYWTQLYLHCHLARTWLIAFLYSKIV